jgi:Cu+-exporting ATPase
MAHEGHLLEEDVVCGMKIKRAEAAGQAEYQGQTFYFCSKEDRETFRADPDRYAGFLALTRVVGPRTYQMAVKPRRPQAGDEVALTLTLPDRRWVRSATVSRTVTPPLEALFFDLGPGREEIGRSYLHMPAGSSPGSYTMGRFFRGPGHVRLVVQVPRADGMDRVPFGFSIAAREESPPPPPAATTGRPVPAALTMEAQHETMRVMGRAWYELADDLARPDPRWDEIAPRLAQLVEMGARLPGFELHKFPKEKAEFLRYGRELEESLATYRQVLAARDRRRAKEEFSRIDGRICTRCHLKFRWGSVADLSRFPDLRDHAKD